MSTSQQIEVQVDYHPSGRLTLKERNVGETWADVKAQGLFGNSDPASFYQQVAKRLAKHAQTNVTVSSYKDTGGNLIT
ncbi:MAG: hypothetical protein HOO95_10140 [Gallionella sp.]|nr:hypothetical protein [Gallionella sp.]